ncbi:hypothetical protein PSGK_12165 [Pseudomonas solani]|uniref:hypothetical protein n=1 Tax=Pseudomonas solani TaxID=2731552 RepID=UPI001618E67C|nr:hypothetical protein [Pseudomonas alcaligenes]
MLRRITLRALLALVPLFTGSAVQAADHPDASFFIGNYWIVGRDIDTGKPYTGELDIYQDEGELSLAWTVGEESWTGKAHFEDSELVDGASGLRIDFKRNGHEYQGTMLWRTDWDNYARVSGYIYRPGQQTDKPGLEAWFIAPSN